LRNLEVIEKLIYWASRFPQDGFMIFANFFYSGEAESLRSQFATLKTVRGRHRKYLPYTFT